MRLARIAAAAARTPMARPLISLACHDKTPHASATCSERRGLVWGNHNDGPVRRSFLIALPTIPTPGSPTVHSVLGPAGFPKVIGALEQDNDDARRPQPAHGPELPTMPRYHLPATQNRVTIAATTTAAGCAPEA